MMNDQGLTAMHWPANRVSRRAGHFSQLGVSHGRAFMQQPVDAHVALFTRNWSRAIRSTAIRYLERNRIIALVLGQWTVVLGRSREPKCAARPVAKKGGDKWRKSVAGIVKRFYMRY